MRFKEEHISQFSAERLKKFRKKMCFLAIAIMVFFVYVTLRIYKEQPFHIKIEIFDWLFNYYDWVLWAILVLLSFILYFMFGKAFIINKKNEQKQ